MLEDKLLVWKFNHGSRDAVHAIYDAYKDDLLTLAVALLNDVGAAEDVVHDAFISFLERRGRFSLTGSLKGYLATCVANQARNVTRARRRKELGLDKVVIANANSNESDCPVVSEETSRQLARSLDQLPYEQREVILLHLHSGMRFRQIARVQNVSINTVQGRYRYGLDKLRSLMNGEVNDEGHR